MDKLVKVEDLLGKVDIVKKLKDLPFESGLSVLEELISKVESGALPLEQSVLAYERGTQVLKHLRDLISGVEQKLKVIDLESGKGK